MCEMKQCVNAGAQVNTITEKYYSFCDGGNMSAQFSLTTTYFISEKDLRCLGFIQILQILFVSCNRGSGMYFIALRVNM